MRIGGCLRQTCLSGYAILFDRFTPSAIKVPLQSSSSGHYRQSHFVYVPSSFRSLVRPALYQAAEFVHGRLSVFEHFVRVRPALCLRADGSHFTRSDSLYLPVPSGAHTRQNGGNVCYIDIIYANTVDPRLSGLRLSGLSITGIFRSVVRWVKFRSTRMRGILKPVAPKFEILNKQRSISTTVCRILTDWI